MRYSLIIAALAIATVGHGHEILLSSPLRPAAVEEIPVPATNGNAAAIDRMIVAIDLLSAKFEQLQLQVNAQAASCTSSPSDARIFDSRGREVFFDNRGRQVDIYARALVQSFCPDCESRLNQSHNFTSGPTHSPTSFSNIPMIDANNNMSNAIPRVIMVEGRPQLILDPEPVSFLQKFLSLRRR